MSESYPHDLASHVRSVLISNHKKAPPLAVLVSVFEVLYFASLKTEEGQDILCRVAFIDRKHPDPKLPDRVVADRWHYFAFSSEISFSVRNLVKLSKAADPWVATIAVDLNSDGQPAIWGLIDQSVHYNTAVMNETQSWGQMPGLFQTAIVGAGEISAYDGYVFLGSLRHGAPVTREIGVLQHGPIRDKLLPAISEFRRHVVSKVGRNEY